MSEWIRLIICMISITVGAAFALIGVLGTFKLKYVLSRMHSAAMLDTCALLFTVIGLVVLSGFNITSLKLVLIVVFLWFASPIASHLISSLNMLTHREDVMKVCRYVNLDVEEDSDI